MLTRPDRFRGDRGQSAMEVLVGLFLMALVGALTFAVMRVARHEVDYSITSNQQTELRQSMDRAMRQIRNARPLGYCLTPEDARVEDCRRIGESAFTFLSGTETELCAYTLLDTDDTLSADIEALTPPDITCVRIDNVADQLVIVTRPADPDATYTTPAWASTERVRRVSPVDPTLSGFEYTMLNGTTVTNLGSASDLRNVALVELTVTVTNDGRAQDTLSNTMVFQAAPRGSRLHREQTFEEL